MTIFWKTLCRIGIISSLNVWQDLLVKSSGLGDYFVGKFLTKSTY